MSFLDELYNKVPGWLSAKGPEAEIVFSSRVRLARNLSGARFPHHASRSELTQIFGRVSEKSADVESFRGSEHFAIEALSHEERILLAERHLLSRDVLSTPEQRGVRISEDQSLSLLINEEDHLRVQALSPGFQLEPAWHRIADLDNELDERLEIAFSDRYGYLTTCPTNTGTGMRVSVMMHLPGLVHRKEVSKILEALRAINFTIRGMYGEGSEIMGNFFQISNNATLGMREEEILEKLEKTARNVVKYEKQARESLLDKARTLLEDKVWRAYGLLKNARILSTKETLSLVSAVRFGIGQGFIKDISLEQLNQILVYSQPIHVQSWVGEELEPIDRDFARAELIRERLKFEESSNGES